MTQEAVKKQPALIPPDLSQAEYNRNRFLARPPEGTTLADILNPDFWAHVARQFRQGDLLEVYPKDGAFYAELFVAECRKVGMINVLRLVKVSYTPLTEEPQGKTKDESGTYSVVWRGTEKKHTVTRKLDNAIVSEGHATKQDAQRWIEEQELNKLTQQ